MNEKKIIPMQDMDKTVIIDAVVQASTKDIHEFKAENDLETYNSIHFLKWDFINKNLIRSLRDKYQCIKVERGSLWEFVLMYEQNSGCVYALMNEKRFNQLRDRKERDKVHYIDALASINTDMVSDESEQLYLFDIDTSKWDEEVKAVLNKMAFPLLGELKRFVLVTFKTEKSEIKSVTAYIPTVNLSIAYEESWNDFVTADFSAVFAHEVQSEANNDEEIVMGLRKGVTPHQNEEIVHLRHDNVEKNG